MNKKLYWIVRQHVLNVIFRIKKGLFRMSEGKDQTDRILPLHFSVLRTTIAQVFKGIIIAWLVTKLDTVLMIKLNVEAFDADMFKDIVFADDLIDEDIEDDIYFDHPDDFLDSREDGEIEEPYYSKDDMLIMISEELDTDDFQRACIIARTYLKDQLDKYSKAVTAEKVDEDVQRLTKSNNRSLEIINKYTAYLNMPKTFNKQEDKANKPKEDDDLTY